MPSIKLLALYSINAPATNYRNWINWGIQWRIERADHHRASSTMSICTSSLMLNSFLIFTVRAAYGNVHFHCLGCLWLCCVIKRFLGKCITISAYTFIWGVGNVIFSRTIFHAWILWDLLSVYVVFLKRSLVHQVWNWVAAPTIPPASCDTRETVSFGPNCWDCDFILAITLGHVGSNAWSNLALHAICKDARAVCTSENSVWNWIYWTTRYLASTFGRYCMLPTARKCMVANSRW